MSVVHHNHYEFAYLVEVVFEVIPITIVMINLLPVMHHFFGNVAMSSQRSRELKSHCVICDFSSPSFIINRVRPYNPRTSRLVRT